MKFNESMQKLQEMLQNEAEAWQTGPLMIKIARSLNDNTEDELDLSTTIGHNKRRPKTPTDANSYWLPKEVNQNTQDFRGEIIHTIFYRACHLAGFHIKANWIQSEGCILFTCNRNRYHNEDGNRDQYDKKPRHVKDESKPPGTRDRKTGKPVKEDGDETCKFCFRVYWDEHWNRWFLPKQQSGCLDHCGHSHFAPKYLRMPTKFVSQNELDLAKDCFATKNPTTTTTKLLNHRSDIGLEWHQLHYLKTKKKNDLVIQDMDPSLVPNNAEITAADRLLASLKNKPNVSYIALTAELNSGLITLKKRRKGVDNSITVEELSGDLEDPDGVDSAKRFAARELGVGEEELKAFAASKKTDVPDNLRLKNGQVLLAIAWTTDESRRKFDTFPEFLFGDATEETNSEERPLYTLSGKDNMNKAFAHTWCFLPSNTRWAYSWFFQDAVPTLHPGTACHRVQLILTDACPQETHAPCNYPGRWERQGYVKSVPERLASVVWVA